MKKIWIFIFLILFIPITQVHGEELNLAENAKSAILIETSTGEILYQKNANEQRLIASTTKIMTAVVAIENKNLDDVVTVGEEVLPMYGSNIYIEVGEKMTLRNLLYGLLLRSGNELALTE